MKGVYKINNKAWKVLHKAFVKRYIQCYKHAEKVFGSLDFKEIDPLVEQKIENETLIAVEKLGDEFSKEQYSKDYVWKSNVTTICYQELVKSFSLIIRPENLMNSLISTCVGRL